MAVFLHQRIRELGALLGSADDVLRACTDRSAEVADAAVAHLGEAGAAYGRLGIPDGENRMVSLGAQMAEARDGINPLTLERVPTRRREMQRTIAVHVLQVGSERLRADYAEADRALAALRERLTPLALYALDKGWLPVHRRRGPVSQTALERVWKELGGDPGSGPATRQVALTSTPADVLLVLGDLLSTAR